MSKGKYTHMQGLEKEILAMREAGAVVSRFMRKIICRLRLNEVSRQ